MRVYLDGTDLTTAPSASGGIATLAEALALVSERTAGRMVVSATADGEPVPDADLAQPPERSPYAGELHFTTADPVDVVAVTLDDAAQALERVNTDHQAVADLLQVGETTEALPKLAELLRTWSAVEQAVTLVGRVPGLTLRAAAGESPVDDLTARLDELAARLVELRDAIQAQDFTAAADTLAYDLPELADTWTAALRDAAGRVMRTPSDSQAA